MAALQYFVRLVDLKSNVVLASTSTVADWSFEQAIDRVGLLSLEIVAGDPGEANRDNPDWIAFGDALSRAYGDLGRDPRPLLIEFSLDDGEAFDSRKLVDHPVRALQAARRTVKEDGPDIASLLSTIPQERVTYTECALQDVFNAEAGTIVPLIATGFLSATNTIPYLAGILTEAPGLDSWDADGRQLLRFTAVINPDVQNQPTNVDADSTNTLSMLETIVNRLAGAAPEQSYGHWVADCSDPSLNLSGTTSWFSSISDTAITNALVVGNKGTDHHITFDATGNADVDETTTARVHLDASSITTDDSTIYHACNFVGGKSTAGWPNEGKVTGLAVIHTQVPGGVGLSGYRDSWQDCLPLVGIDAGNSGGGVYLYMGDGQMRRLSSFGARCLALAYDQGEEDPDTHVRSRYSSLFMATPHGVFWTGGTANVDLLAATTDWLPLQTKLNIEVSRLQVLPIPDGHIDAGYLAVFALVTGKGDQYDGVWRCTTGSREWEAVHLNRHVLDMCATDFGTFWTLENATQRKIHRCLYNESSTHVTLFDYPLPSGSGKVFAIQRVVTADYTGAGGGDPSVPRKDSVWALMAEAESANSTAYYLVNDSGGAWGDHTFYNANVDGTLKTAATGDYPGQYLQAFRVGGLGFAVNGQYVSILMGTDSGVYWSKQPLGGALDWHSANELGGLGGYDIHSIGAGDYQWLLDKPDTNTAHHSRRIWRMFSVTENDLLVSNSAGRWWHPVRERDRTTMGPHLSAITWRLTGDLPSNRIRTWGTRTTSGAAMTGSPFGTDWNATHIHIPPGDVDAVPTGYYFERYLDAHHDFQYRLVKQDALFPGMQLSQLPELQSNQAVGPDRASKGVMTVAKRWLQQHAAPQTLITIESSFSTTESALRRLRPTHKAKLIGQIVIRDVSVQGAQTSTRVLDFSGDEDLWVLAHTIKKGPGTTATTTTTLAPVLRQTPTSESDMMSALSDSINSIRIWG